ncbi:MAG: MBL fold metallo-hydrolase [Pirellulales bacterium]|nr:MBL fold metallo-hydrolase [Pirellulales bacterium]
MELGDWRLDTVSGGRLRLDGGAMFGIVPRPLWEQVSPPDERHRIRMATNCLLARNGRHTVLIETGPGSKQSARERDQLALEPGEPLVENLAALGVSVDEINTVILTHLHFDHSGGATRRDSRGHIVPTFPRATYVVQRAEWEDATSGAPELRNAYPQENFAVLADAGRLALVDGDSPIVPGISALVTSGHTRGHQSVLIETSAGTAIYLADLCPTTHHLRTYWCMAYDTSVLDTRRRKPQVLGRAADEGWHVLWGHDPDVAISRLVRDEKREFAIVEPRPAV